MFCIFNPFLFYETNSITFGPLGLDVKSIAKKVLFSVILCRDATVIIESKLSRIRSRAFVGQ